MLAKEIDKSPDARTYRTVAVIDCTEWHFHWQHFICQ